MKNLIKLEELGMFLFSFLLFYKTDVAWWWFLVFLITPDISMLGYLAGPRSGAIMYNIFHHKGLALLILISGYVMDSNLLYLSGIILFGHSSMDRLFGYGLKYEKGFKFTHLGKIGN